MTIDAIFIIKCISLCTWMHLGSNSFVQHGRYRLPRQMNMYMDWIHSILGYNKQYTASSKHVTAHGMNSPAHRDQGRPRPGARSLQGSCGMILFLE